MEGIFKYAFLFGAAWVVIGSYFLLQRTGRSHLSAGRFTEAELKRFALIYGLVLGTPLLALGVLQLASNNPNPICVFSGMGRTPTSALALGLAATFQVAFFLWVWAGPGARVLTRFAPVIGFPPSPTFMRLLAAAVLALGLFGWHQLTNAEWAFAQCATARAA